MTGLSVSYRNVVAVHDATFTVAEGDACAITGPNGNGKSSILMGVTGMVRRENSQEGWDAGLEVDWAIKQAGSLDETAIMQKLQHLNINTLGIVWTRTPANYESYSDVDAAMAIINPDGSASLYQAGT